MNKECKAGVNHSEVRDPNARPYLFPCLNQGGHCDKCKFPTPYEVEQEEKEMAEMCGKNLVAFANVKNAIAKGSEAGIVPCACGGKIHFAVAGNGHSRAKCNACDISWIE